MHFSLLRDAHLAVTAAMAGICWFVQVVHYPLFSAAGPGYPQHHARLTAYVVMPLMLAELALAIVLILLRPSALTAGAMVLLLLIWASTFFLQVPYHERLQREYTEAVHRSLVRTNWIRTFAWTARTVLACCIVS